MGAATSRRANGRFDPIAAVEAAYGLDGGLSGWLEGVAAAARPDLDCGLGVQAVLYDVGPEAAAVRELAVTGTPPGMEAYLHSIHHDAPADHQAKVLGAPTRLYSYSQFPGPLGPEKFFLEHPIRGVPPFRDWLAVVATEPRGALMLGGFSPRTERPSRAHRRRWQRIATHLSAGMRLARQLSEGEVPATEAVLAPDGRCLHAEGSARDGDARRRLRAAARRMDEARGRLRRRDPMEALQLWRGLVDGRWSLVDRFESDGRRFLVALRNDSPHRDPRALTRRQGQIAHLVVLGLSNKEIGYALGLSESTVGTHVSAALRKLGLARREDLAAEMAARDARTSRGRVGDLEIAVASRGAPALPASAGLSAAEEEIVGAMLRGQSDSAIASARGRSPRTVANQLRSAFRKLGVSTRGELVARLAKEG